MGHTLLLRPATCCPYPAYPHRNKARDQRAAPGCSLLLISAAHRLRLGPHALHVPLVLVLDVLHPAGLARAAKGRRVGREFVDIRCRAALPAVPLQCKTGLQAGLQAQLGQVQRRGGSAASIAAAAHRMFWMRSSSATCSCSAFSCFSSASVSGEARPPAVAGTGQA